MQTGSSRARRRVDDSREKHATSAARPVRSLVIDDVRSKPRASNLLSKWAIVITSALFGCFSPDLSGAECTACPVGWCPGEMRCEAGYCLLPGSETQCVGSVDGAGDGGLGGEGGARAEPGGGVSGAGGSSNLSGAGVAGTLPTGGTGGTSGTAEPEIRVALPEVACTGGEVAAKLSVKGGRSPYSWLFVENPHRLVLDGNGSKATLAGEFSLPGDYSATVRVTDADGLTDERRVTLGVNETPVVEVIDAPLSVCPDEIYSKALSATGGDSADYEWSSDLPSETGLEVSDGRLQGRFRNATNARQQIHFDVRVESDGCVSAPVELTLVAEASGAVDCPRISVLSGAPTLPSPCRGSAYSGELIADLGADGEYTWSELAAPEGLAFDVPTRTVTGTAAAAGTLTVAVEDAAGRKVAADYELVPRTKCWLAYVSNDADASKLQLIDPVLPRNRRAFPDDAVTEPVIDFEFSPDGRFVAYRSDAPGGSRLSLVELATQREESLGFGSVSEYAWSNDGLTLAVGFGVGDEHYLGGVVVRSADSAAASMYSELEAQSVTVSSPLVWYGSSRIGFLSSTGDTRPFVASAARTATGFSQARIENDSFASDTRLKAGAEGLFLIPSGTYLYGFYPEDGSPDTSHRDVLVAESGRYAARATDGELQVFRATDSSWRSSDEPHLTAADCDEPLAWAKGRDRLACAHGDTQITFFDMDSRSDAMSGPYDVLGLDETSPVIPSQLPRIFSPSGDRFAFTTANAVYSVDVRGADSGVEFSYDFVTELGTNGAVLAFSPDERLLLEHRGTRLSWFDLEDSRERDPTLATELSEPLTCTDDSRAPAGAYCGEERSSASFAWGSDSRLVGYSLADGHLEVIDLPLRDFIDPVVITDCAAPCAAGSQFAFQP